MSLTKQDAQAIVQLGNELGVDPVSLGGLMELESGINPNVWGGAGGKYRGLIQFGPGARAEVGLPSKQMTVAEQIPYVKRYFQQRGFKPGEHGVTEMYRTVLVGNPFQSGKDTFGTESDSAAKRMMPGGDLYERARQKLESGLGGQVSTAPRQAAAAQGSAESDVVSTVLLNKFIDLISKPTSSTAYTQAELNTSPLLRSKLEAPALPSFDEEAVDSTGDELSVLLSAIEGSQKTEDYQKALAQQRANELSKNLIAAEVAKNQLFSQAIGAFGAPKSLI